MTTLSRPLGGAIFNHAPHGADFMEYSLPTVRSVSTLFRSNNCCDSFYHVNRIASVAGPDLERGRGCLPCQLFFLCDLFFNQNKVGVGGARAGPSTWQLVLAKITHQFYLVHSRVCLSNTLICEMVSFPLNSISNPRQSSTAVK